MCHSAVPAAEVFQGGELGFVVEEIVFEHPIEIVVDEQGTIGEQKGRRRQHVVDRLEQFSKLGAQIPAVGGPFPDASLSEFPLFVADEHCAFDQRAFRDHVGIVHLKPHRLQLVFNVAGEDELESIEVLGKELKSIAPIDVPRDLLSEIRGVAESTFPIDDARHAMSSPLCGGDDGGAIVEWNVA